MSFSSGPLDVEAVLKLTLDQVGAANMKAFMKDQEDSFSRMEQIGSRISDSFEGATRMVMGLAGVAGIGAIANNFLNVSTAGSNVALAAGQVTGGADVWHTQAQGLLADQAKTGVNASSIAQGLVLAIQGIGIPSPAQAAVIGGLLAGYGQSVGLTPAQVSQVLIPLLQSTDKTLTTLNAGSMLQDVTAGLTSAPGSQAAGVLQVIAGQAQQQAIGSTTGATTPANVASLTAITNVARQSSKMWNDNALLTSATGAVQSGLQNAYTNPAAEAFMTMAGISYDDQRFGLNTSNVDKITAFAEKQYPNSEERDMVLRSMFGGLPGADLLETMGAHRKQLDAQTASDTAAAAKPKRPHLQDLQAATTPESELNKLESTILGWIEKNPLTAAIGGLGVAAVGSKVIPKAVGGALDLFGGTGAAVAGESVGTDLLSTLLGGLVGGATAGVGAYAASMVDPASAGMTGPSVSGEKTAVEHALEDAQKKFGTLTSPAALKWMWNQFGHRDVGVGKNVPRTTLWDEATAEGEEPAGATGAQQILAKALSGIMPSATGVVQQFDRATLNMLLAAQKLSKIADGTTTKSTSFDLGMGGSLGGSVGTSAEFTALALASGTGLGAVSGTTYASLELGAGGSVGAPGGTPVSNPVAGGGAAGAGWQACTLTWYDPALGGTNSSNGAKNPNSATASGQPYSATAMTCAAPPSYAFGTQIQFAYGGQVVTCTVNDRGGAITGSHFDLSRGAASALGMISAGIVSAKFKVVGGGASTGAASASSGGSAASGTGGGTAAGGGSAVSAVAFPTSPVATTAGAAGSAAGQSIHVHVHVDGRKIQTSRVLLGHKA